MKYNKHQSMNGLRSHDLSFFKVQISELFYRAVNIKTVPKLNPCKEKQRKNLSNECENF
jgi:hypothetical protein